MNGGESDMDEMESFFRPEGLITGEAELELGGEESEEAASSSEKV